MLIGAARRGAPRRTVWHPYRLVVIAICLAWTLLNIWFSPSQLLQAPAVAAVAVATAVSVAAYWFPIPCSLALAAFVGVGEYAIPYFSYYDTFYLYMAVGLFAYEATLAWTLAFVGALCAYVVAERVLLPDVMTVKGVVSMMAIYALLVAVGRGLRGNRERTERLRESLRVQSELRILKAHQRMAMQLHDTLSQRLAVIAMVARQERAKGGEDLEAWACVDDASGEALQGLRDVIRLLNQQTPDVGSEPLGGFTAQLRQELRDGERLLALRGFRGHVRFDRHDAPATISSQAGTVVLMAVREVCTNILKHGDSGVPYDVHVQILDHRASLDCTNGIAAGAAERSLPGGNGLRSVVQAIRDIDGTYSQQDVHGVWRCHMDVPLTAGARRAARGNAEPAAPSITA